MRFAHFSDIHLGYEQYNLTWREEDFYRNFKESARIAIKEGVDFVLIAGDLFHKSFPNPKTLSEAIDVLRIFNENKIPVFAIEGNHDKSIREMSAYHLLENLGLLNVLGFRKEKVEGDHITSVRIENVYLVKGVYKDLEIIGERHRTRWQLEKVLPYLKPESRGVLLLHQAVKEAIDVEIDMNWDLTIDQLPEANYYAFGHIHLHREKKIGDAFLVYPGSLERYDSREASSFINYSDKLDSKLGEEKGFCLVENFRPRFVPIETRDLYSITIDAEERGEAERKFAEVLKNLKKSAIAVVKVTSSEIVDSKKLLEMASKYVKHLEISFRRKGIEESVSLSPEREFFSEFELKLFEILKEDDESSLRSAIEMIKEKYGFADLNQKEKKEKVEIIEKEETKKEEKTKKKFKTLLDFV
ncbi:MAG: exonuclease SbcCD subunit D [Archaeoglobaceae archaeon]|nr:exonuclease SbcCD subunit D [Archaeoglobaceae archaeon]